jgi:hypothetical protein
VYLLVRCALAVLTAAVAYSLARASELVSVGVNHHGHTVGVRRLRALSGSTALRTDTSLKFALFDYIPLDSLIRMLIYYLRKR